MTLFDLICYLRLQVLEATIHNNLNKCADLLKVLDVVREAAYENKDEKFASLIQSMIDNVQDVLMGTTFKSNLPTVESIKTIFGFE